MSELSKSNGAAVFKALEQHGVRLESQGADDIVTRFNALWSTARARQSVYESSPIYPSQMIAVCLENNFMKMNLIQSAVHRRNLEAITVEATENWNKLMRVSAHSVVLLSHLQCAPIADEEPPEEGWDDDDERDREDQ